MDDRVTWEQLLGDLRPLIEDLKIQANGEGTTWYAIDEAELHSFLEPQMNSSFRILDEDDRAAFAIDQQTLRWLLFEDLSAFTSRRLLLLPPHELEFGRLVDTIQASALENVQNMTPERVTAITEEAEELARSPHFRDLANQIATGAELQTEVVDNIVQYLASKASTLNWFLRVTSEPAVERLNNLLERSKLVEFEFALELPLQWDQSTYGYWSERLPRIRKDRKKGRTDARKIQAAAYSDASVVALLKATNDRLRERGDRICLITRSQTMFDVHATEKENPRWEGLWPILRHPRGFAALRYLPDTSTETLAQSAEKMASSIELFLSAAPAEDQNEFQAAINQLHEKWLSLANLAVASQKSPRVTSMLSRSMALILEFFDMVHDTQEIRARVEERRRQLLDETEKSLQLRQFLMSRKSVHHGLKGNAVEARVVDDHVVLSCRYASVPFQIEFYDRDLRALPALFPVRNEAAVWDQLTRLVKAELSSRESHEIQLLLAYLMAVVGNWGAVDRYCRIALTAEKERHHETKYFLAVANRKNPHTLSRFRESLRLLDAAKKERAEYGGPINDPRYQIEYAVQIYYWHDFGASEDTPPVSEAIEITEAVISGDSTPTEFRLQAAANLLDFLIGQDATLSDERASVVRGHLDRWRNVVTANPRVGHSPYVEEAFAWASFVVNHTTMSSDDLDALIATYHELAKREEFTRDEMAHVEKHASAVRRFRQQANSSDDAVQLM